MKSVTSPPLFTNRRLASLMQCADHGYDEHINPLMAHIAEICRADKIAFGLVRRSGDILQ